MELIKGRHDDLTNKIRPGAFYVNKRNDNFNYIDKDGAKAQLIPESRYYAVETIKRGQPISIAQKKDLQAFKDKFEGIWDPTGNTPDGWDPENDSYAYCKITDPDVDDTCLGIAMNYAEPGQIVSVQSRGKFSFLTTKHPDFETRKDREVFIDIDAYKAIPFDQITGKYEKEKSEFNFDQVRGQPLYIRKSIETLSLEEDGKLDSRGSHTGYDKEGDLHDTDHLDTSRKADAEVDGKAWFTWDYSDSIYNTKNTIQVGYLTDAPTTDGAEDEVVTIELNITGDTRGPIDNTQFLVTLGEDIYFNKVKQDVDLEDETGGYDSTNGEPDFARLNERGEPSYNKALNTGVYDEVKVVAIAEGKPRPFSCEIRVVGEAAQNLTLEDAFIGLRKLDGDTIIIPVVSNTIDYDDLADPNDEGYIRLSKSFCNAGANIIQKEPMSVFTPNLIRGALIDGLKELQQNYHEDEEIEFTSKEIADGVFEITSNINEGYYDVYVSHNLLPYMNVRKIEHGQSAEAGQAILADVRDASRLNVIGVVLTNQTGVHKKGDVVKVLRMGRMVTMGNLKPGTQYYLGLNGRITARPQYWYDFNVPIGIAESCNYFIVDVKEPLRDYSGNFPLGYIKPSNRGLPEKGFALMDGITLYDKRKYPELYNALRNWFDEEDLKPSGVTREQFNATMAQKYYEFFGEINEYMVQIHKEAAGWRSTMEAHQEAFEQYQDAQRTKDESQDQAFNNYKDSQTQRDADQDEALRKTASDIRREEEERATEEAAAQKIVDEKQDAAIEKAEEWDDEENNGKTVKETFEAMKTTYDTALAEKDSEIEALNDRCTDLEKQLKDTVDIVDKFDEMQNGVKDITVTYNQGRTLVSNKSLTKDFKDGKYRANEDTIGKSVITTEELQGIINDPLFNMFGDPSNKYFEFKANNNSYIVKYKDTESASFATKKYALNESIPIHKYMSITPDYVSGAVDCSQVITISGTLKINATVNRDGIWSNMLGKIASSINKEKKYDKVSLGTVLKDTNGLTLMSKTVNLSNYGTKNVFTQLTVAQLLGGNRNILEDASYYLGFTGSSYNGVKVTSSTLTPPSKTSYTVSKSESKAPDISVNLATLNIGLDLISLKNPRTKLSWVSKIEPAYMIVYRDGQKEGTSGEGNNITYNQTWGEDWTDMLVTMGLKVTFQDGSHEWYMPSRYITAITQWEENTKDHVRVKVREIWAITEKNPKETVIQYTKANHEVVTEKVQKSDDIFTIAGDEWAVYDISDYLEIRGTEEGIKKADDRQEEIWAACDNDWKVNSHSKNSSSNATALTDITAALNCIK